MAVRWGLCIHVSLCLLGFMSRGTCEGSDGEQFAFNGHNSEQDGGSDLDPTFFQDGNFGDIESKWDAAKRDIHKVLEHLPKIKTEQISQDGADSSSATEKGTTRAQTLKQLYRRMLMAAKEKRSLYGNVLGGYKLGKREFMPYELMNEYQKRLFGSVLNNLKYGKRVPEELPANYVTGGQIYDNISDDPNEQKRIYGSILSSYKMGKRSPRILQFLANEKPSVVASAIECLRRPDCPLLYAERR